VAPLDPALQAGATAAADTGAGTGSTPAPSADPSPGASASPTAVGGASAQPIAVAEPDGGWGSGWWSDRWLWTAAGGVLGALSGVGGSTLSRHPRRPSPRPPVGG
jgi:hypothetical protein